MTRVTERHTPAVGELRCTGLRMVRADTGRPAARAATESKTRAHVSPKESRGFAESALRGPLGGGPLGRASGLLHAWSAKAVGLFSPSADSLDGYSMEYGLCASDRTVPRPNILSSDFRVYRQ